MVESQVTHDSTKLPSAFRAPSTRTPVRDATNELRQALTPIDALLALMAEGPVDVEALADAREGWRA
ncbi:MAG: hypothetical protein M5U28_36140 [Sandaracinaceae bacterium]|nr:hypothetical protein [Sandaracinaceae bacterium]